MGVTGGTGKGDVEGCGAAEVECGLEEKAEGKLGLEGKRGCGGGPMFNSESWLNTHSSPRASKCQAGEGLDHAVQYDSL